MDTVTPQPSPVGDGESVTDKVISDLKKRREGGIKKYGTELKTCNGRDALIDAYQEALDLSLYLRQAISERDNLMTYTNPTAANLTANHFDTTPAHVARLAGLFIDPATNTLTENMAFAPVSRRERAILHFYMGAVAGLGYQEKSR